MALCTKAGVCGKVHFTSKSCRGHQAGQNKIGVNLRNPRLIKDLRLRILTYEIINLFLQNEPKFRKSQMNVTDLITMYYEKMDTWLDAKNEPKTNPNEPKSKKAKMNVTSIITKAYENISIWAICENEPNQSQFCLP